MITINRTTLNENGNEIVVINPGTSFEAMSFDRPLTVTSYARITDEEGNLVVMLMPGDKVTSIGVKAEDPLVTLSKSELKQLCIEQELSYPSKATIKVLLAILKG